MDSLEHSTPIPHQHEVRKEVQILHNSPQARAISQIECLLESILDAVIDGHELIIPYKSARSLSNGTGSSSGRREARPQDVVRFPGRTTQEAKRFEALFRIIELAHEALLSGNVITKRSIYYQSPDLFKSQNVVDDMVDNLAFTLGLGREDLNIVAAAKGLIAGTVDLTLHDGSVYSCETQSDTGTLLPSINSIQKIYFRSARWALVIEKEATFRTLAAAKYFCNSNAGDGILLTAKGYPDLATRRFLCTLHANKPEMSLFALVDFDPHGVAIMRTYKYGSHRLNHEEDATTPGLRWLGIRSDDILASLRGMDESGDGLEWQSSQGSPPGPGWMERPQDERPNKRPRVSPVNAPYESASPLTSRDRKRAVELMREISAAEAIDVEGRYQLQELQRMLMLNIKAEIQAVDNYGDIALWLDSKLTTSQKIL
ncbi:hypothetical protein VTK26DRAFT_1092 [Humicola hyalothermophila]